VSSISEKLGAILQAKNNIKTVIEDKGVSMSDNPPFGEYAGRIADIAAGGGAPEIDLDTGRREYTAQTSGIWTVPDGVYWVRITAVGAGGGGGGMSTSTYPSTSNITAWGASGGGSSGELRFFEVFVEPGDTLDISIGAGGSYGAAGASPTYDSGAGWGGGSTVIKLIREGVLIEEYRALGGKGGGGGIFKGDTSFTDTGGAGGAAVSEYAVKGFNGTSGYHKSSGSGFKGKAGGYGSVFKKNGTEYGRGGAGLQYAASPAYSTAAGLNGIVILQY
jgi:hypothetical protein